MRVRYGGAAGLGYELELIHHKLYFERAAENAGILDRFTATDGFNYLLFNLAYPLVYDPLRVVGRVGAGLILPTPRPGCVGRPTAWRPTGATTSPAAPAPR